jgi:hypothetical protein
MIDALTRGALLAQSYAAEDWWADEFLGFDAEQRFAVVMTVIGCITGIIVVLSLAATISSLIRGVHGRHVEARLKREMLDRGLAADDIVKVIEAGPAAEESASWWACCSPKK